MGTELLFVLWGTLSLLMFVVWDVLLFGLKKFGWERLLAGFIFFYFQVVCSEFLLGVTGQLTRLNLIALNLIITGGLVWLIRKRFTSRIVKNYFQTSWSSVRVFFREIRNDGFLLALVALAGIAFLWITMLAVLFPVTDYDGNSYHMTFIAHSIQTHSINDFTTSVPWLNGYPKGGELIQLWNVLIPGNEMLADLAQLPFILLGVLAVYGLALRSGVEKQTARFSAMLIVFIPVVLNQTKTTYVDVMFNCLFLAVLAIVTKRHLRRLDYLLIGTIYALLLSVKSVALLIVVVTIPFVLRHFVEFKRKKISVSYKLAFSRLGLVALPMLFGFYWYIKNLIMYGSPLHPFGFKVAGISIFPGKSFQEFIATAFTNYQVLPQNSVEKLWFVWTEQKDWFGCLYNYDATFSGMGPLWFVVLLPSIPFAIYLAIKRRNYIFGAIAASLVATFALYPANFYARYTFFIVTLGILSYGLVAGVIARPAQVLAKLTIIWLAFNVLATNLTLCNFTPATIREQISLFRNGDMRDGSAYSNMVGKSYRFMQTRIESGETVVYDSRPDFIYPLWKSDYSNKVIYVPAANKDEWIRDVKLQNVRYVFTTIGGMEHGWSEQLKLNSIYKDVRYEIYQIY